MWIFIIPSRLPLLYHQKRISMTICHSFWSKPCNGNRWNVVSHLQWKVNLYCFMMSCLLAQKHGCRVVFYGDREAIEMFKIIPYDDMIELIIPEDAPLQCWAQGKFYAYQKMNPGDIHIDGDVFLKGDGIYERLAGDYDCIVQSKEVLQSTYVGYIKCRRRLKNLEWSDFCTSKKSPAYNVGICGFKNQEFKDRYIKHYFDSLEMIKHMRLKRDPYFMPDLLLEQQHLYEIAKGYKYNVQVLLGDETGDMRKICNDAYTLGYQHVLSSRKYEEFEYIRADLMKLNPHYCSILDEFTADL